MIFAFATMSSQLFLPDSQASAVQFPPSCPVIFVVPAKRSSCSQLSAGSANADVDGGDETTASTKNGQGTIVRLGIVKSVYIDISAGSNRELIYVVEVPNNTTVDVPESSLRYAPNCSALFDLDNLTATTNDNDTSNSASTIVPALDITTVARGIILWGIPAVSAGSIGNSYSYSAMVNLDDGSLREYHNIPLRCIRFDPAPTTNAGTDTIAPSISNPSTNISSHVTTKPNIISKQSSIDSDANDNDDDDDDDDVEDTKCRPLLNNNNCEDTSTVISSAPKLSINVHNLITTKPKTVSKEPKSLGNKTNTPQPTSVAISAVDSTSPQKKTIPNASAPASQGDTVHCTKKETTAVVSPIVLRTSPHFRSLQLHLEKESSIFKQLQPPNLSLSSNNVQPSQKETQERKSAKVTAAKKYKPRKKGHGRRRSSGFGRGRGRASACSKGRR